MKRATQRPLGIQKPAYWSNDPSPEPKEGDALRQAQGEREEEELSPTRYGDWVRKGIAIDF
jgi:hypothetical protein